MELGDQEFDRQLNDKRYKDLILVLNKILTEVSKEVKYPPATEVKVEKIDTKSIEKLLKLIAEKESSEQIPSAIKTLGTLLIKKLDELKEIHTRQVEIPKEWIFTVNRSNTGYITSVTAKHNV